MLIQFNFYFQHQQQVVTAVERAKQVTMQELNTIVGVSLYCQHPTQKYKHLDYNFKNYWFSYEIEVLSKTSELSHEINWHDY